MTRLSEQVERVGSLGGLPLAERVLAVRLAAGTEVVNVHSPNSRRPGLAKVFTHEAVHDHLVPPDRRPVRNRPGLTYADISI